MANRVRTRLDPEARRSQLVTLGLEMLATKPLGQVGIDAIAAAAGISRGLLFHYFPTKRAFHVAVARAAADELLARTEPDPSLPLLARLRAGLEAFVDYVGENPDAYVALVRGAAGSDQDLQAIFDETRVVICRRVYEALGLGASPPDAVVLAVRGWVAFTEEVVVTWLAAAPRPTTRHQLVTMLEQALVRLVDSAAWPTALHADRPRSDSTE